MQCKVLCPQAVVRLLIVGPRTVELLGVFLGGVPPTVEHIGLYAPSAQRPSVHLTRIDRNRQYLLDGGRYTHFLLDGVRPVVNF